MPEILFVCTANRFRSPLSAQYFECLLERNDGPSDLKVSSAGTWTRNGQPATREAAQIARSAGFDLGHHRSREVTSSMLVGSDLILVMESGQKEAISFEFPEVSGRVFILSEAVENIPFDIPDPYSTDEPSDRIARELFAMLEKGYEQILLLVNQVSEKETGD